MRAMLARSLLLPAAAVAALAVAQPAAAKPTKLKTAKFSATFEASYTTTWNEPKRLTGGSVCGGLNYQQGSGEETWTIKTRKPQKILAYKTSYGAALYHGTWDPQEEESEGFDAFGNHQRQGRSYWTTEPGTCGGVFTVEPKRETEDCGRRLPEYRLRFDGVTKLHPNLMSAPHMRKEKTWFADCHIKLADELLAGDWPKVEKKLPVKSLFAKGRKPIKITGTESWDNADEPTADRYTTSSKLTWTLTLTRRR